MASNPSTGGGAATHAGTNYQNRVAAWTAVQILAEQDVTPPWGLPAGLTLESLHAEAPHAIDDLNVDTSVGGRAFAQAKHTVGLETTPASALGSTIAQFVREFCAAPLSFSPAKDRFVLVTSPTSSAPVRTHLTGFLTRLRTSSDPVAEWTAGNQDEQRAASVLRDHIAREWQALNGVPPTMPELTAILGFVYLHILDVDPDGHDETGAKNTLRQRILKTPADADLAWNSLIATTANYATNHQRADRHALQRALTDAGVDLQAPRSYHDDIDRLTAHTTTTLASLLDFSRIHLGNYRVTINRPPATALRTAAHDGHLLILGTPGAGKSGALHDLANALRAQGAAVVLFAVDQLEATSIGNLRNELALTHDLTTVLTSWPGTTPGYVLIDALDAARTDGAIRTLNAIIEQVIASNSRWRVIASVRKFDLRYNAKLRTLFHGTPPTTFTDTEFPTIRHVNIPTLTDDELAQVAQQSPTLSALMTAAPAPLQELLRLPFNLRLLAELLGTGINPATLQPLTTQVELLDRYWLARIIREDALGDARELVLGRTTNAMVHQRALRIPRTAAMANDTASSAILKDLLSTHVLAEWTTPAGLPQRDFLTFPHHLLFDYAVARLAVPPLHADLIARLTAEPDLFIAIRPSIDLHFQRFWHTDQPAFWELTFLAIAAPIPEIGKLIGPSVAALHATSVADFQPLLDRLNNPTPAALEAGMVALRHVLMTLVSTATNTGHVTSRVWCELLDTTTATMTPELAFAARPSLWHLATHNAALTPQDRAHLGTVARRLLTFALSLVPNDHGLLTVGITAVNNTSATEPVASITLLRHCLTPNHLQTIGHRTLSTLADGVPTIASVDPGYVHDLYVAALQHQTTSTATTSMGNSQILPLTSNALQDYKHGLFQLGEQYPAFLTAAPSVATTTLLDAIDWFTREHHNTSQQHRTVHVDGTPVPFVPDRSASWDSNGIYEHDLPITMLDHWRAHLEVLANQQDQTRLQDILRALFGASLHAVVWRRVLRAGTNQPATLGRLLRSLAWDRTILTSTETTRVAGTFLHAIHPVLDETDRARIETAILAIPTTRPKGTHERDRLLGCLDPTYLATDVARTHLATLNAQGGPPLNAEDDDNIHWGVLHPATPAPTPLDNLRNPIKAFLDQYQTTPPTLAAIDDILPHLVALHDAITHPTSPLDTQLETDATTDVLRACARIVHSGGLTNAHCAQLVPFLLHATTHSSPEHDDDEDQAKPVTSWCDAPRLLAAQGLILIARYSAGCTTGVRSAIRDLGADPVRVVRLQIADHLDCLFHTAIDLLWDLLEYYARVEQNPTLLIDTLHTLRRMPYPDAARTVSLTQEIQNRTATGTNRTDVRDACIHVFCSLALHANDAASLAELDRRINDPTAHTHDVQRLILDLSVSYAAADPSLRAAVFALTQRILTNVIAAMRAIEAVNNPAAQWPTTVQEEYGGLMRCADEVGQRLFLASGAFKAPSPDRTLLAPDVFYQHAKPLIRDLAGVGHPHLAHHLLDTVKHFIPVDPPGVLLMVGDVVRTSSKFGIQYESLAEGLMVDIVERYLAEYRLVLREHRECHAALMDVLDVFVRVGWPRAHQLTYQLSDIYR